MKKKLVITSDCFLPRWDGIARFLSQLIPQLRNEYEITCIVPEFEGEIKIQGVNIIRIPLLKIRFGDIFFSRFQYRKIKEIISKHDLIFISPSNSGTMQVISYSFLNCGINCDRNLAIPSHLGKKQSLVMTNFFFIL